MPRPKDGQIGPNGLTYSGDNQGFFQTVSSYGFASITDGLSNTVAIGEVGFVKSGDGNYHPWVQGRRSDTLSYQGAYWVNKGINPYGTTATPASQDSATAFCSVHPGGANFAMGDGAVRFLSETIDYNNIYLPMCSANAGDTFQAP